MESHGYPAINSEKTMFMKWEGDDFILHGLFVDDMSTIPTSDHLKEEFMALYSADFDVTGGDLMKSFLGWKWNSWRVALSSIWIRISRSS